MDLAKYWGVVGQRKMSCAATGKGSMSKVSPGLWWWHQKIYELWNISLLHSMVVVTLKSHRGSPDLIPRMSQIYSPLLPRNWRVKTMRGGGDHEFVCRWVSWLLQNEENWDELFTAKTSTTRGASHQPAFMGNCLTISHMW